MNPKPYCKNIKQIKAFVLGCDPTAFDKFGNRLEFEYVFDLGNDQRYFAGVLRNLSQLGLGLEDVYVQNLVTRYLTEETSKNKSEWKTEALIAISERKLEFDKIDPTREIPVFLTAYMLYEALINHNMKLLKAKELYEKDNAVPILSTENKLNRPLIPFFRHPSYSLVKKHGFFVNRITNLLKK